MTTPDTLAELIAKMPHNRPCGVHIENCLRCKLEAALDALVEKPLLTLAIVQDAVEKSWRDDVREYNRITLTYLLNRACAAELRGRGANVA